MTNAELIDLFRNVERSNHPVCNGCPMKYTCDKNQITRCLFGTAADALETADKLNAELIKNIEHWKKYVVELRSQLQIIKSRIYDLESMAKREYDDDPDNEYLEGYFDGLHQAAKLISTTLTIEKGEHNE